MRCRDYLLLVSLCPCFIPLAVYVPTPQICVNIGVVLLGALVRLSQLWQRSFVPDAVNHLPRATLLLWLLFCMWCIMSLVMNSIESVTHCSCAQLLSSWPPPWGHRWLVAYLAAHSSYRAADLLFLEMSGVCSAINRSMWCCATFSH